MSVFVKHLISYRRILFADSRRKSWLSRKQATKRLSEVSNGVVFFPKNQESQRKKFIMVPNMFAGTKHRKERLYHIDDTPSGVAEVIQDLDKSYQVSIVSDIKSQ